MTEYKQPKTRIRKVEDGYGVKYYPEYLEVLIPIILQEWMPIRARVDDPEYTPTFYEAACRIDTFLVQEKQRWDEHVEREKKKKVKKKTTIIKYP